MPLTAYENYKISDEVLMDNFDYSVKILFSPSIEGGYVNDPDDPGGETNFGISKRSYPHIDIKGLTPDRAKAIYRVDWWEKYRLDLIKDAKIASQMLRAAVNMGASNAFRCLRQALSIDTLGATTDVMMRTLNSGDPKIVLRLLQLEFIKYYANLNKPKYFRGWVNRVLYDTT